MHHTTVIATAVFSALASLSSAPAVPMARGGAPAQATAAQAAPLTAEQLAPFLGDWTLAMQGPNGPGSFDVSIAMEKDKPRADITAETMPKQAITEFGMTDKSLSLGYTFNYEGNPVSAVIWLTPSADGPMKAQIDFAGGAYVMNGTAAKKEKK